MVICIRTDFDLVVIATVMQTINCVNWRKCKEWRRVPWQLCLAMADVHAKDAFNCIFFLIHFALEISLFGVAPERFVWCTKVGFSDCGRSLSRDTEMRCGKLIFSNKEHRVKRPTAHHINVPLMHFTKLLYHVPFDYNFSIGSQFMFFN